jgi:hypothetical protein
MQTSVEKARGCCILYLQAGCEACSLGFQDIRLLGLSHFLALTLQRTWGSLTLSHLDYLFWKWPHYKASGNLKKSTLAGTLHIQCNAGRRVGRRTFCSKITNCRPLAICHSKFQINCLLCSRHIASVKAGHIKTQYIGPGVPHWPRP